MIAQTISAKTKTDIFVLSNGTVELLKWLALFFMTLDHFNKYVYSGTIPYLYEIGRLAMPLFSFVFAYNLARPKTLQNNVYQRVLSRLFVIGLISCVPFIALSPVKFGFWPLNILFTLFFSGLIIFILEKNNKHHLLLALVVFILGGSLVEFWWPALLMTISVWLYLKTFNKEYLFLWIFSVCSLFIINNNFYALLALPIIYIATKVNVEFPRWKYAFYIYYPGHLIIIWLMTHNLV